MRTTEFSIQDKRLVFHEPLGTVERFTVRSTPRGYSVRWEAGSAASVIQALIDAHPKCALVMDAEVHRLFGPIAVQPERLLLLPADEAKKTLDDGVLPVLDHLTKLGITKAERVIVVGGGIIQDIAAFAAAMYRRGVPWSLVPTTLLSMSDSCIGAKASLNHGPAKNQLGLFSAPAEVVLCPGFLVGLTGSTFRAGLGEILKLHIAAGASALAHYEELLRDVDLDRVPPETLKPLILGALSIKRAVIEEDEFELDIRRGLNFGHTVGHAVEALTDFAVPHGLAVTLGMLVANRMACRRGILSGGDQQHLEALGQALLDQATRQQGRGLDSVERMTDFLSKDKKTSGTVITFVFLSAVGQLRFVRVENDPALAAEIAEHLRGVLR